ncbi:CBP80/20-dependent translation initiation factor-like [Ptychodera flava]|uniref:CBP80/20-dependent translation initiation factor-like n=1 Tax=Ptychodera flava TaxID=63121 RepID=UPI003969BC84
MATTAESSRDLAYRGRGRGRGIRTIPEGLTGPLRRPNVNVGNEESRQTLEEVTRRMQLATMETIEEDATQVINMVRNYSVTGKDLQEVASKFYKVTLDNSKYGIVAAELAKRMANFEVEGAKFRNLILKLLQSDFIKRDVLRRDSMNQWLGFVTFLIELLAVLRTQSGDILKALLKPSFVSLTELLTSTDDTLLAEEELEHCVGVLKRRGQFLQEQDTASMECLMKALRDKILDVQTSAYGRCLLLELLEMSCRGWGLSDDIKEYYKETITRH